MRTVLLLTIATTTSALVVGGKVSEVQVQRRAARPLQMAMFAPTLPRLVRRHDIGQKPSHGLSMCSAETNVALTRLKARLWSVGWLSWWVQIILSTISGVLLLFANSVSQPLNAATITGRLLALGGLTAARRWPYDA